MVTVSELADPRLAKSAGEAAELLSAMANPKRLMILCMLANGEMPVNAIASALGASQALVSQHLARLRALKLVETRREAQTISYRLASPEVRRIIATLAEIYCPRGAQLKACRRPVPRGS
jgi:DNA-binding transcriptional ArsR family regulator